MVLTEAIRMAESNSSPINNILAQNSVSAGAGIAHALETNTNNKAPAPTLAQPTLPERGILGAYEGTTSSSSRSKAPIYTRDKRTKFTQRENKKWVRLATVLGYLVAVCIPAIALSVYYIGFWDPNYKNEYVAQYLKSQTNEQKMKEHRQQPQQCCTACNCPGLPDEKFASIASREPRDVLPSNDMDSEKSSVLHHGAATVGEKAADGAYYQHVLVGKNYAIYGAVQDDASVESGKDPSPSSDRLTDSTSASAGMTGTEMNSIPPSASQDKARLHSSGVF